MSFDEVTFDVQPRWLLDRLSRQLVEFTDQD